MNRDEFIAHVRHIAWCSYQLAVGQAYNLEPTSEQWASLLQGVHHLELYATLSPKQNHENWMRHHLSQGWRYGPKKDVVLKTHPDLVPYDQLPEAERRKDEMDIMAHRMAAELWRKLNGSNS